jgi:hypothetical protein
MMIGISLKQDHGITMIIHLYQNHAYPMIYTELDVPVKLQRCGMTYAGLGSHMMEK